MTCAPFLNLLGEGKLFYFRLLSTHDELFCFEVKLFARSERWPFMLWIGFTCNLDSDFMISIRNPFLVVVGVAIVWIQNPKRNPSK